MLKLLDLLLRVSTANSRLWAPRSGSRRFKYTTWLNTTDALRVRTHKLECTRCLLRVLADFSVHGVKIPARNGQTW